MSLFNKNKFHSEEKKSESSPDDSEPGWLKNLEEMREKRKGPRERRDTPPPAAPGFSSETASLKAQSVPKAPRPLTPGLTRKTSTDPELKKKVYAHYAARWQEEHNQQESASGDSGEQVLLTQTWTLQADRLLLKPQTLLTEEVEVLEFSEEGALRGKENQTQDLDSEGKSDKGGGENRDKEKDGESRPMVQVTIVRPPLAADKPLAVIDEKEFSARLKAELKPQLQDLLESSLKNMLLNNYDIMLSCVQQEIQKELPQLIDEALEYNLKKIIKKEIK